MFKSRATVYRLGRERSRARPHGSGPVLPAMVSQRRILSLGVTGARGSFTVLMEPDEAPWKVTELIKGATMGLWREQESEDWKTKTSRTLIKVLRAAGCPAAGLRQE